MTQREPFEREPIYGEVEIVDAQEAGAAYFGPVEIVEADAEPGAYGGPAGMSAETAELLDMLVSRFEESLIGQEREIGALQRSLEEAQASAAADRAELETVQHVCRILERENQRLTAEVELLRGQVGELEALRGQAAEAEELRQQVAALRKRRRIALEVEELRRQVAELSSSSDRMLEQMLRQQLYS
jgi:DNA repair ATPase RecN